MYWYMQALDQHMLIQAISFTRTSLIISDNETKTHFARVTTACNTHSEKVKVRE